MEPELRLDETINAGYGCLAVRTSLAHRNSIAQRVVDYDISGEIMGIEFPDLHYRVDLTDCDMIR